MSKTTKQERNYCFLNNYTELSEGQQGRIEGERGQGGWLVKSSVTHSYSENFLVWIKDIFLSSLGEFKMGKGHGRPVNTGIIDPWQSMRKIQKGGS